MKIKPGDILIIIFCIILVVLLFLLFPQSTGAKIAQVFKDKQLVAEYDLSKIERPILLTLEGNYTNVILIEKNSIRYKDSNCPDRICVKTGTLSEKNHSAACLPNAALIKITGEGSVDIIAQ